MANFTTTCNLNGDVTLPDGTVSYFQQIPSGTLIRDAAFLPPDRSVGEPFGLVTGTIRFNGRDATVEFGGTTYDWFGDVIDDSGTTSTGWFTPEPEKVLPPRSMFGSR